MFNRKCKHKNLAQKFVRTKKYSEDILLEYQYCVDCGEVFKGTVTFVKPTEVPQPKPTPVKTTEKLPVVPAKAEDSSVTQEDARKASKVTPKKKSVKKKLTKKKIVKEEVPVSDTNKENPTKKVINRKPPRGDSELRKHSRKPTANEAPEGATLGDILRAKYGVEKSGDSEKLSVKKTYKKQLDDPYDNSFEDDGDVQVFLK